jgi:hypothetical protein
MMLIDTTILVILATLGEKKNSKKKVSTTKNELSFFFKLKKYDTYVSSLFLLFLLQENTKLTIIKCCKDQI